MKKIRMAAAMSLLLIYEVTKSKRVYAWADALATSK